MLAEAWVRTPRRWHAVAVSAIVLVAVFDHVSGLLLFGGLLAVAGVRGDREAWRWRFFLVGAVCTWALTWGPSFLSQSSMTHASWIDHTTLTSVVDVVSGLVTNQSGVAVIVLLLVGAGLLRLVVVDPVLGRVVLCCGVLPFCAAAVIGVVVPFFIDRSVTVAAWAPCLAIGLLVDAVWRRSHMIGVCAAVLIGALVLPATLVFLMRRWEYDASAARLIAVARPGDVVATVPGWYGPLVDWRIGVQGFGRARAVVVPGLRGAHAISVGHSAATGRVWVLSFAGDHRRFDSLPRCAPDWTDDVTVVSCLEVPVDG
jgi:hypothetical protein